MIRQYARDQLVVLGKTGFGTATDGMTLGDLQALVEEAVAAGMDPHDTRVCSNMKRGWRGVVSLFLINSQAVKIRGRRG